MMHLSPGQQAIIVASGVWSRADLARFSALVAELDAVRAALARLRTAMARHGERRPWPGAIPTRVDQRAMRSWERTAAAYEGEMHRLRAKGEAAKARLGPLVDRAVRALADVPASPERTAEFAGVTSGLEQALRETPPARR